ncbi:ribosome hibernation-promoting factor, HPF/YfiA family [Dictyobacter arantiisoli]|uniref:RNA-binding protein n=1 Tax=Dictyobacter arantiisoli TaxID=2014874 RepID=A0A5A5TCT7_9CHLR|nr:ribosome-associated translation inhibitor RaiA [Dictyobacter arantiisoli]GCF09157.1 RNA-binding protein [Dictyobacter arantiisoli]
MQIIIKSRQMQITPQLRAKIERKVQRLSHWLNDDARVEITVLEEQTRSAGDRYTVQLALANNPFPSRSEVSALTATAALDLVLDKVVAQLGRQKGRVTTRRQKAEPIKMLALSRGGALSTFDEYEDTDLPPAPVDEEDNEEIWTKVLEIRRLPTTSMTDHEVIEQMEKSGTSYYPFFNSETNSVNVMYKLDTGGYGLLVPAQE